MNTKLVYERKRLVRERDELKSEVQDHRRSCPNCTSPSSEEYIDLVDDDLPRAIQIQTRRSTSQRSPSSASQSLSRSLSCPESSVGNLSQLHWTEENDEDEDIEMLITSSEDEDDEEQEEEEVEEEEVDDDPTNTIFSPDDFSFTQLGIAEPSGGVGDNFTSDLSLIGEQQQLGLFQFEEQSDFLGIEEDPFSLLDDLPSSPSAQIFGRSAATNFPIFSKPSSGGVDVTRNAGLDSSQSSSSTTSRDLGDPSGVYYDDQQSEAIDLSKPRAALPTTVDPSSVRTSTSLDSQRIEQKVTEPAKAQAFVGNIPLHVQNFIVGEK